MVAVSESGSFWRTILLTFFLSLVFTFFHLYPIWAGFLKIILVLPELSGEY
jgi:hypothetical protein